MAKRKLSDAGKDLAPADKAKRVRIETNSSSPAKDRDKESKVSKKSQQPEAGPSTGLATKAQTHNRDKSSNATPKSNTTAKSKPNGTIRKLAPSRPFPVVPTSVSATGPKSAFHEGKNLICITRKITLAAYLKKCKRLIMEDGYKTLHLSALGAAIPLLATLSVSIPAILPYPEDSVHIEVKTGTVDLVDEIIPEEEDEDITTNTREKSSMSVVIRVGDDTDTKQERKSITVVKRGKRWKGKPKSMTASTNAVDSAPAQVVVQEHEQDDMDD